VAGGWKRLHKEELHSLYALVTVIKVLPVPMAARSYKARTIFSRSNTGIVGSNPAREWMCIHVFLCCAVLCR
jgi:hypothetical protein